MSNQLTWGSRRSCTSHQPGGTSWKPKRQLQQKRFLHSASPSNMLRGFILLTGAETAPLMRDTPCSHPAPQQPLLPCFTVLFQRIVLSQHLTSQPAPKGPESAPPCSGMLATSKGLFDLQSEGNVMQAAWHGSPSVARAPPSEWPQQSTLLGSWPPDSCLMTSARLSFGLAMELTAANCCMNPAAWWKHGLVSCLMTFTKLTSGMAMEPSTAH